MRDNLMAEEIEIDLLRRASPFRTAWKGSIKIPSSVQIASSKSNMEGSKSHLKLS